MGRIGGLGVVSLAGWQWTEMVSIACEEVVVQAAKSSGDPAAARQLLWGDRILKDKMVPRHIRWLAEPQCAMASYTSQKAGGSSSNTEPCI